jgi:hypothetical protein
MTTNIYLDESGFTGDDLYNPDQRFFTIASTVIQNDEAKDILARCFPHYQGSEYKFTNIWKRKRSREGLLALAAEIPTIADRAFVWVIDKRFCLLTKMVDYLVEPGAYEAGYDWYANGWGMRYLNTIHRDLVRHGTDKLYDNIVRGWDDFARAPSEEKLEKLKQQLEYGTRAFSCAKSQFGEFPRHERNPGHFCFLYHDMVATAQERGFCTRS